MLISLDERVLRGVDRLVVAAEHPVCKVEQRSLIAGDEWLERRCLSGQALRHKLAVILSDQYTQSARKLVSLPCLSETSHLRWPAPPTSPGIFRSNP